MTWQGERVHTDICARCGVDRPTQRRDPRDCKVYGENYRQHHWGWVDSEHGQPDHSCGSCL
jgi:hypothetical protein